MIKFDNATKEIIKKHNQNWPQIPEHSYKIEANQQISHWIRKRYGWYLQKYWRTQYEYKT